MGESRGRHIAEVERQNVIELVKAAQSQGSRKEAACQELGVNIRTLQRWKQSGGLHDKRQYAKHNPPNKLSAASRAKILEISNSAEYCDLPPSQIVPRLADKGMYVASESSFYRVLREENQLHHRGRAKAKIHKKPEPIVAIKPQQAWSWDITYLPTAVRGMFFYLYLIVDIYSRKIVGSEVYERESSGNASVLVKESCLSEGVTESKLILHSDNGSPMKGATLLSTLQSLGITPSFSRPSVSNDNPYSESLFKTLKYCPRYPRKGFASLEEARAWVKEFKHWYNEEHLHSGINFVTPSSRHTGADISILAKRKKVYLEARARHPERWSGSIRNWSACGEVYLNPGKAKSS